MSEQYSFCLDQLVERLTRLGYAPGDLQMKWRTEKGLKFNYDEIDAALLDAFVIMGMATAWTGDGSSCAVQIVQNIIEERDKADAEAAELASLVMVLWPTFRMLAKQRDIDLIEQNPRFQQAMGIAKRRKSGIT